MKPLRTYRPAVSRNTLILVAGFVWLAVGALLLITAGLWLRRESQPHDYLFVVAGVTIALFAHHFGFLRIVDRNLKRLLPLQEKRCLFSFVPWKSYLVVVVMITMGAILRHSAIPKHYLSVIYIGVGLALVLSSVRYLRVFVGEKLRGQ